jgi:HPt (histidine-containing phosphotransfer) domain-containing protein
MKSAVDLEHLSRYTGGDEALNAEVLTLFDNQTTELVAKLSDILEARDSKGWKQITHTLKGAARGIGAFKFADVAAAAEPIDVTQDHASASLAISAMKISAVDVQSFIRTYLGR